ncbi:MAG TPA: hypothetical protein VMW17_06950 [Candidatus Binatia bacterium]|nr:hypothetical protein [Candidatus Binatia bacterium]
MATRSSKLSAMLVASAVAGLLAASAGLAQAAEGTDDKVHCYGINKCKGTGDCSGKGHQCAGHNACKGKGHINLPKDVCLRIKGGHLTPKAGEEG